MCNNDIHVPTIRALVFTRYRALPSQDWGPNKYTIITLGGTPTFNSQYMSLDKFSSEYAVLPDAFRSKMATLTSYTSCFWVYPKTVRPYILRRQHKKKAKLQRGGCARGLPSHCHPWASL
jgi:hypothetical protein